VVAAWRPLYMASALFVVHCVDAACAAGNSITTPGWENLADEVWASHISLRLDGAGNPVLVFQQGSDSLKLLRCTNPNC
jgi:hypothetical protein